MNKAIRRLEIVKADLKEVIEDKDTYSDVCMDIEDILAELLTTQTKLDSLREYCERQVDERKGDTWQPEEAKRIAYQDILTKLEGKEQ